MKEATAINVQSELAFCSSFLQRTDNMLAHVEEFKKELKREVHGMTREVGRLYKERQTVENQIADLFAFYSKQKSAASGMVSRC